MGQSHRGFQCSRFGALNEAVELTFDVPNDDDDDTKESVVGTVTSEMTHVTPATAPPFLSPSGSYQTQRRASAMADEAEAALDGLVSVIGFGRLQGWTLVCLGLGMLHASILTGFVGLLLPDMARDLCLTDESSGWLRKFTKL